MASNKDLRTEIEGLCAARGTSIPDGIAAMNNAKLQETLDGLQRAAPGADASAAPDIAARPLVAPSPPDEPEVTPLVTVPTSQAPGAPSVPPGQAPQPAAPSAPTSATGVDQTRYFVAEGKLLTTLGDDKGAFEQILPRELPGGKEQLEQLVAAGYVTKR
jgi:hypothetical protein